MLWTLQLTPGSTPGAGAVGGLCPLGFQSKLASAGFSPVFLHVKLDFLSLFVSVRSEGPSGKQCLYTEQNCILFKDVQIMKKNSQRINNKRNIRLKIKTEN